ncbi:helix-turn-helix domain-containing protein [Propionimicrobium lymphophilum]|uniref:helix-turn-helix domain-containing protein n=1 Tax=Propionimicrobium lymphophilum TaxID=33012 RepID=UPI0004150DD9|nr:helix-turn-helix domain-containing protein [Propionimicrobium lymphophilum]
MKDTASTSTNSLATDKLLTCRQAAQLAGIDERSMRTQFNNRRFELVKLGRRIYVRTSTLEQFVNSNTLPSAKEMEQ